MGQTVILKNGGDLGGVGIDLTKNVKKRGGMEKLLKGRQS